MEFRLLDRCLTVCMKACQTLVACIGQDAKVFREIEACVHEQLKIVFTSIAISSDDDLDGLSIHNYLRFLSMALLFTAIVPLKRCSSSQMLYWIRHNIIA